MNALQYNNDQYTFTELGLQEKLQCRLLRLGQHIWQHLGFQNWNVNCWVFVEFFLQLPQGQEPGEGAGGQRGEVVHA